VKELEENNNTMQSAQTNGDSGSSFNNSYFSFSSNKVFDCIEHGQLFVLFLTKVK